MDVCVCVCVCVCNNGAHSEFLQYTMEASSMCLSLI